jgi:hypothetical protein
MYSSSVDFFESELTNHSNHNVIDTVTHKNPLQRVSKWDTQNPTEILCQSSPKKHQARKFGVFNDHVELTGYQVFLK